MKRGKKNRSFGKSKKIPIRIWIIFLLVAFILLVSVYANISSIVNKRADERMRGELASLDYTPYPTESPYPTPTVDLDFSDDPNIINPPECTINIVWFAPKGDCPNVACYSVICNAPLNGAGKCVYTPIEAGTYDKDNCPDVDKSRCDGKGKCTSYECYNNRDCFSKTWTPDHRECRGDEVYEHDEFTDLCINPATDLSYCSSVPRFIKNCDPNDAPFSNCMICTYDQRDPTVPLNYHDCFADKDGYYKNGRNCKTPSGIFGKCQNGICEPISTPPPSTTPTSSED